MTPFPLVILSGVLPLSKTLNEKECVVNRAGADGTGFVCVSDLSITVRYLL